LKNSKVVSFLSPFKVGQTGNLWTLPRSLCEIENGKYSEIMEFSREATKLMSALVLPNHQHTLKMGTELGPETSGNLHILTRLSARENAIELCRRES